MKALETITTPKTSKNNNSQQVLYIINNLDLREYDTTK